MPGPKRSVRRTARKATLRVARMDKETKVRLGRLLEEWLAEARIRYTYAGE